MNVLVAGGAGYIGSHTVKALLQAGHSPVIFDNCSRGQRQVIDILKTPAVVGELADRGLLVETLRAHRIDTVMHFAAYAYVGESVERPLDYYRNNVATTIGVLEAMREAGVERFVFSSTCAVYGDPEKVPITEDQRKAPVSPYGRSKLMVEQVLQDYLQANRRFSYAALRYFNASGCAMDGTLGEDHDPETHLIPCILLAMLGKRPNVTLFGTDYPTPDGTCIRDYIHVLDLAEAHVLALEHLLAGGASGAFNVGLGRGYSVKEVLRAAEAVTGSAVPFQVGPRRAGDAPVLVADSSRLRCTLGWEPRFTSLEEIIRTAWEFERRRAGRA